MGVFDRCLMAEEFAYGCSGIGAAIDSTGLGVSTALFIYCSVIVVLFWSTCYYCRIPQD
jgi:hypothetical protein